MSEIFYFKNNFKVKNSGYSQHGASRNNPITAGWQVSSKSAAEDISENIELLRKRSRDLYAGGGPLGRGAIERILLNSIGPGLNLNCRIDAEYLGLSEEQAAEWEAKCEREFYYWAESKECDYSRQFNFFELQNLAFKSMLINGDALVLLPIRRIKGYIYDLKIALIEGDRLQLPVPRPSNKVIDGGVELDERGAPIAYYIANRHPEAELSWQKRLEYVRVPAFGINSGRRNILHLMPVERIGQHRGLPFLSPVIEVLKQLGRYTDAELMAAVVGGMYAIFFTQQPLDKEIGVENDVLDDGDNSREIAGLPGSMQDMYGLVMQLPEGVEPKSVSPARPNTAFDAFVTALTRQVGSALGLPAEVLFLNFQSSYSASRGALLEAWKLFNYWRSWWAANFCQPVYCEWLREAVLKGRIKAPGFLDDALTQYAYSQAEWTGPSQGQLNPVQEVKAAALRVEHGFSTIQRESSELTGSDWELNHRQLVKEFNKRKEAGLINGSAENINETEGAMNNEDAN